jgi:pimeloyl-ACP methyl ester carboxylesterase
VFSETRYAMNGDLSVAYRASPAGERDIVFVPNWFTNCEVMPELPSLQGWVEAMSSLGRLIFLDHPGTGASDPVTPDAPPNMEQWADSITAVLDDLGSTEAVLLGFAAGVATGALFAATYPSRTTALVVLDGYADTGGTAFRDDAAMARWWGTGQIQHAMNPDMPWNEEIRATWARWERMSASPRTVAVMYPLVSNLDVRAVLPTVRVPTLVVQHSDNAYIPPAKGKYIAEHIPDAKYVELPGRNWWHFVRTVARVLPGDRRISYG